MLFVDKRAPKALSFVGLPVPRGTDGYNHRRGRVVSVCTQDDGPPQGGKPQKRFALRLKSSVVLVSLIVVMSCRDPER
jgi:hypothetical protein